MSDHVLLRGELSSGSYERENLKENLTCDSVYVLYGRGKVIDHFGTASSLINVLPWALLMGSMLIPNILVYTVSFVVKIIAKKICL